MIIPEAEILSRLSTKMVYPIPSVSLLNDHSEFVKLYDIEFTGPFTKNSFNKEITSLSKPLYGSSEDFVDGISTNFLPDIQLLDNAQITEKANTIIANQSAEIFMNCIKDSGFIVNEESSANTLLSVIQFEKELLEKVDNSLAKEIRETGKEIKPDGIIFDEFFVDEIKGIDIGINELTDEQFDEYVKTFDVGFGTFEEFEKFLYPDIKSENNSFIESIDNIFE